MTKGWFFRRHWHKKAKAPKPKKLPPNKPQGPDEFIFSLDESRRVLVAWLYASEPWVKKELYMLVLLGMGRSVDETAEICSTNRQRVLDGVKVYQDNLTRECDVFQENELPADDEQRPPD